MKESRSCPKKSDLFLSYHYGRPLESYGSRRKPTLVRIDRNHLEFESGIVQGAQAPNPDPPLENRMYAPDTQIFISFSYLKKNNKPRAAPWVWGRAPPWGSRRCRSRPCPWGSGSTPPSYLHMQRDMILVITLDNSEIGAQISLWYLICLRHLIRSREVIHSYFIYDIIWIYVFDLLAGK